MASPFHAPFVIALKQAIIKCKCSIAILIQAALFGAVVVIAWALRLPWWGMVAFGLVNATAAVAVIPSFIQRKPLRMATLVTAWTVTILILASALDANSFWAAVQGHLDGYYAVLEWIIAAGMWPIIRRHTESRAQVGWKLLALMWALSGSLTWVGISYGYNFTGSFYFGLLLVLALFILCHAWFRLGTIARLSVNTIILFVLGLPLMDLLVRCAPMLGSDLDAHQQYYRYELAQKDPRSHNRWWRYYSAQFHQAEMQMYETDDVLGYRLRPNSRARVAQSLYSINSRGFRGPEIPIPKGNAYRIVALGESTTFGITLNLEDHPWPERLEQMIIERIKPRCPVQVINAGVPGYRLDNNLQRFSKEILPLEPDMVISYHGINGFALLKEAVPFAPMPNAPMFKERPLRLLADCEYNLKLNRYRQNLPLAPGRVARPVTDPLKTAHAELYRNLIQSMATNHIRLVLANYSMAANDNSAPDIIKFLQLGYPKAPWQIQANRVHSALVQTLAGQHPEVTFVDTHPHLDGEHEKFIDLVHFSPAGDQQLAETFFSALRPILELELSGRDNPLP